MKRMPFEPPTEHYDEQLINIDEQICDLLKQRKDISNNNPGFPNGQFITNWSKKYNSMLSYLIAANDDLKTNDALSNKEAINKIYSAISEAQGYLYATEIFDGNRNMSFGQLRILLRDFQTYQSTVEYNDKGKKIVTQQLSLILKNIPSNVKNLNELNISSDDLESKLNTNYEEYKASLVS